MVNAAKARPEQYRSEATGIVELEAKIWLPPVPVTATAVESTGGPRHGPWERRPLKGRKNPERDGTVNGTAVTAVFTGAKTSTERAYDIRESEDYKVHPNCSTNTRDMVLESQPTWPQVGEANKNEMMFTKFKLRHHTRKFPPLGSTLRRTAPGSKTISPPQSNNYASGWQTRVTAVTAVFQRSVVAVTRAVTVPWWSSQNLRRNGHGTRATGAVEPW
ncbi:hypothetical protein B0H12DRAFT_1080114 [Mycena haematopus]|nr:hypothetical protein B0H12DRAFT_1080114 [Mycena haematopus]